MTAIEQADQMADRAIRRAAHARHVESKRAWLAVAEYYVALAESLLEPTPPGFAAAMAAPVAEVA